jgi:hypothetical protein
MKYITFKEEKEKTTFKNSEINELKIIFSIVLNANALTNTQKLNE